MHRVCLCLPRKLAKLGEAVVSKCSDAASRRVKFTQCDVDDPGTGLVWGAAREGSGTPD